MQNILIIYHSPSSLGLDCTVEEMSDNEILDCFRVRKYDNEAQALWAYAETPCTWSKLADEDYDFHKFIQEALPHIKSDDYEWLEENFT